MGQVIQPWNPTMSQQQHCSWRVFKARKLLTKRTFGIQKLVARLPNKDTSPIGVPSRIVPSCTTGIVFEAEIA